MRPRVRVAIGLAAVVTFGWPSWATPAGSTASTASAAAASTAAGVVTTFPGNGVFRPEQMVAGPDGALWFTNNGSIGRISTDGAITTYRDPSVHGTPDSITVGSDGALWYANTGFGGSQGSIGRITTTGVVSNFTNPTISFPYGIVAGPDGALWFTNELASLGRITTTGIVTQFVGPPLSFPGRLSVGPDGALWFPNNGSIGRITTDGTVTTFPDPRIDFPLDAALTVGPDGALWFPSGTRIGRVTTGGTFTFFNDPALTACFCFPGRVLTDGPDGALWYSLPPTTGTPGAIDRMTTNGVVTSFTDPAITSGGYETSLTVGPDGALWFPDGDSIGRITVDGSVTAFKTGVGSPTTGIPQSIAPGPDGGVWFADYNHNAVGHISPDGTVSTQANPINDPLAITAGPDGAIWFLNRDDDTVGRISPTGAITTYPLPSNILSQDPDTDLQLSITAGSDGALWFTTSPPFFGHNTIGRITTSGTVTIFNNLIGQRDFFGPLAAGPDGALWAGGAKLHRITIAGQVTKFSVPSGVNLGDITAGPDGALWFTNPIYNQVTGNLVGIEVGRVTLTGVFRRFLPTALAAGPNITAGPDGALWSGQIRMAVNGQWTANGVTTPGLPIIAGPDGALWLIGGYTGFGPGSAGSIDRLRGGVLTTFTNPDISFNLGSDFGPSAITAGPDGAVWFVDPDRNLIGRITTASSVTTLPTQGPRGSIVTLSGHGFASGEGVSVAYQTGLASPSTVQLCNPRTAADGTWTCTATVPGDATAGHHGTHTITAIGKRSGRRVATMYLLTR